MENQSQRIKLPTSLGIKVAKILQEKHHIEPSKNRAGLLDFTFTQEELNLITALKMSEPSSGDLEGLHFLTNLQRLELESKGTTAHMQQKNIASINDKDIKEIANCTSLKELSIINQANIGYVDVSKLQHLEDLRVLRNQNLDTIMGLDKLSNLWRLECYGNERLFSIDGLDRAIVQNQDLQSLSLDVLLFPNAIGYQHQSGEYQQDALDKIEEIAKWHKVFWKETLTETKDIKINTYQMTQLHNKACEILESNVPQTSSIRDTAIGIEQYLAQNVKYDYEGANHAHSHVTDSGKNGLKMVDGPTGGTNGAYNALMKNTCVCEGYTRAMQYLLKLRGINSHNVDCYAGKDTTHMADNKQENQYTTYQLPTKGYHSIICIDDYNCLYDDPCWNACRYQKGDTSMQWILKTKEEISEDHTLSFDERTVSNNSLKVSRSAIEQSIQNNQLFIQSRTSSVNETRNTMKQQVKGQIVKREEQEK